MSIVLTLEAQFAALHARSVALVQATPREQLYWQPRASFADSAHRKIETLDSPNESLPILSCGENVLRSAGIVEQTFGGITSNLWDDPFEWTLPESLPTPESVINYLNETEATRRRGFALLQSDADLAKEILVPAEDKLGRMQTLAALIIETLARAAHYQGRAYNVFRLFSRAALPRV
jgi:hypothetical protein